MKNEEIALRLAESYLQNQSVPFTMGIDTKIASLYLGILGTLERNNTKNAR